MAPGGEVAEIEACLGVVGAGVENALDKRGVVRAKVVVSDERLRDFLESLEATLGADRLVRQLLVRVAQLANSIPAR